MRALSLLLVTTAGEASVAAAAVSLIGTAVADELVEVMIGRFEETCFPLKVGTGGREVLKTSQENKAEVSGIHSGRGFQVPVSRALDFHYE